VVTLVFTDLVGSTELLDRLGETGAEELRRIHFNLLRRAVAEHGGQEVKSLGDGLMVVFGAPDGALRCAVAIQQSADDHNRDHPDQTLAIRIGIDVGDPVREEDDYFGTAVNVAKRLCDRARGGQILATESVAELAGPQEGFHFRPAGRLTLRGLRRPQVAVSVEWLDPDAPRITQSISRSRPPAPRGPRFVDRHQELSVLESELIRSGAGEFRCALLVGESGLGKSRLAGEFLARQPEDVVTLSGRAHPLGSTTSFGLWIEALDRYLRPLAPEEVTDLCGGVLDDLAGLLRSVAIARGSIPPGEVPRFRLLEALDVLVGNLAQRGPMILVLDDVQWADASSWDALHYLARALADRPVVVLAVARPVELAEQAVAGEVLAGLEQDGVLRRLSLGPLPPGEIGELTEAVLGSAPPHTLVDWLVQRSQGNALFALGLLQALQEEGADLTAPSLRSLPEGLADRVTRRLAGLDEPVLAIVELLAVIGRPVSWGRLTALEVESPERLGSLLERLVRLRLVVEEERGRELTYQLAHPLVQETVYRVIGAGRRRSLHRLIGRSLVGSGQLGEAAPHFARAADVGDDEAITVLREAIRQAEEREAYREALSILGTLVELIPAGDPRWLEVLDAMSWQAEWVVDHRADVHAVMGITALRAIDAMLESSDDLTRRATVKFRLTSFLAWGTGELEEAEQRCREALALFEEAGDFARTLIATNELAWIQGMRGDLGAWEAGSGQAATTAVKAGIPMVAMPALGGVGYCAFFRGRFADAEEAFRSSLVIARQHENPYRLTLGLAALAIALAFEGRVTEALSLVAEAKASNPAYGDSVLLEWETIVHWLAGDYRAALLSAQEAVAWNPGGMSRRRAIGMAFAALAGAEAGRTADAGKYLARGLAAYGDRDWMFFRDYCLYAGGVMDWQAGRGQHALPVLEHAARRVLSLQALPTAAFVLADVADLAADQGQGDLARWAAVELEEIAAFVDRPLYRGLAATAAAWAALAAGAPQPARGRAGEAVEILSGLSYPAFRARALHALGASLRASADPAAAEALSRARDLFEGCGATWRAGRVSGPAPPE
jgi:tetratricopeptide (TPR) repeat protein